MADQFQGGVLPQGKIITELQDLQRTEYPTETALFWASSLIKTNRSALFPFSFLFYLFLSPFLPPFSLSSSLLFSFPLSSLNISKVLIKVAYNSVDGNSWHLLRALFLFNTSLQIQLLRIIKIYSSSRGKSFSVKNRILSSQF